MDFYLRSVTSNVPLAEYLRMVFDEGKHDRAPKGADNGGQFVSKAAQQAASAASKAAKKARPRPRHPARRPPGKKATQPRKSSRFEGSLKRGIGMNSGPGDDRVRKVQRDLNRLGIRSTDGKPLAVDGRFGPQTERAVKELQRRMGMEATGQVDFDHMMKIAAMKSLPDSTPKKKQKMCPCRSGECLGGDIAEFRCAAQVDDEDDEPEPAPVLDAEARALILAAAGITER